MNEHQATNHDDTHKIANIFENSSSNLKILPTKYLIKTNIFPCAFKNTILCGEKSAKRRMPFVIIASTVKIVSIPTITNIHQNIIFN